MAEIVYKEIYPGRFLYTRVDGDLSNPEWFEFGARLSEYVRQGQGTVHIIIDMIDMKQHPLNPQDIIEGASWLREPKMGWSLHLTHSKIVKMLAMIAIQRMTARYRRFDRVEEALEFIQEADESLIGVIQSLPADIFA